MRPLKIVLWWLGVIGSFCVAALLQDSCANWNPPIPDPKPGDTLSICVAKDPGPYPGSCGKKTTREGYRCVVCAFDRGCVTSSFEYCTSSAACDDPMCEDR